MLFSTGMHTPISWN